MGILDPGSERILKPLAGEAPVAGDGAYRAIEATGDLFSSEALENFHFDDCAEGGINFSEAIEHLIDVGETLVWPGRYF